MPKHGKRYRDMVKDFDSQKEYSLDDAVNTAKMYLKLLEKFSNN